MFVEGARGYDVTTGELIWSTGRGAYRPSDDRLSSAIVWRDRLIQNGSVCDLRTARFVIGSGDPWAGQNCDALADDTIFTLNSGVGGAVNLPRLEARELATGHTIWSRDIVAPGQPVSLRKVVLTSPTVWQGKVYVGFDGGQSEFGVRASLANSAKNGVRPCFLLSCHVAWQRAASDLPPRPRSTPDCG